MSESSRARQALAVEPGSSNVLCFFASEHSVAKNHEAGACFAMRALSVAPNDPDALYLRRLTALALEESAVADRMARRLACIVPSEERAFFCLIWDLHLLQAPDLLRTYHRRPEVFRWMMRSYAALGFRSFTASPIFQCFRELLPVGLAERLAHYLGESGSGDHRRVEPAGAVRQYLIDRGIVAFIGEMAATLDCLHKMMDLSLLPRGEINFVVDERGVSNRAALDLWASTARLVSHETVEKMGRDRFVRLEPVFLPFGRRFYFKWVVFAMVQRLWERRGRPSLIDSSKRDELRQVLHDFIGRLGWHRDDRIVCLHIRQNIYGPGGAPDPTQKFRTTDAGKFLKSIRLLLDAGYKVVRIGARGDAIFPEMPGYFDYANSETKFEALDLAIMGHAAFYFGTDSGPASVAYAFGRPICVIDFAQLPLGLSTGLSVHSPQLFWSESKQRFLTLREMIRPPLRYLTSQSTIDSEGIRLVPNTEDEVLAVLREFLHRFEENSFLDEATFGPRQAAVRRMLKRERIVANGLVCEEFLARHASLLDMP